MEGWFKMLAPETQMQSLSGAGELGLLWQPELTNDACQNVVRLGSAVVRRNVSVESQKLVIDVVKQIRGAIIDARHFLPARSLGVSVLSNYRFRELSGFPSTDEVSDSITSASQSMPVCMAKLAFFGKQLADSVRDYDDELKIKGKLAIELNAPDLLNEEVMYEEEYARRGFTLSSLPGDGEYRPHITLATVCAPLRYFKRPATIASLNRLSHVADHAKDRYLMLDPVTRHHG